MLSRVLSSEGCKTEWPAGSGTALCVPTHFQPSAAGEGLLLTMVASLPTAVTAYF